MVQQLSKNVRIGLPTILFFCPPPPDYPYHEDSGSIVFMRFEQLSNISNKMSEFTVRTRPEEQSYKIKGPESGQEDNESQDQGSWDPGLGK